MVKKVKYSIGKRQMMGIMVHCYIYKLAAREVMHLSSDFLLILNKKNIYMDYHSHMYILSKNNKQFFFGWIK